MSSSVALYRKTDPSADDTDDDSNFESFHINEQLIEMIRHPQAGHPANISFKFTA